MGEAARELILIRHGPTDRPGRLCGRTDPGLEQGAAFPDASALGAVDTLWVSPAARAVQTAAGLWPGVPMHKDARLWEQDFGGWEDMPYTELPDVGVLSRAGLVDLTGPGGESFRDVVARTAPAFEEAAAQAGRIAIVAHAGVIRAALALALEAEEAPMAFEIDHFSATRLRCLEGGGFSILSVNETLGRAAL